MFPPPPPGRLLRLLPDSRTLVLTSLLYLSQARQAGAQGLFESRYQYYQEDDSRIRVDSDYSLWAFDLSETLKLEGSFLYSAISGASPTGLPPAAKGKQVPVIELEDDRYAVTLGLTSIHGKHSIKPGFAYSYEPDYESFSASLQDTISLNEKSTDLVLGFSGTWDTVGAAGSALSEDKTSYDAIIGVRQVLGPDTLLQVNAVLGWKDGFLSDPYKRALIDDEVFLEERPDSKFEQLLFAQITQFVEPIDASVEASYRFGHNDHGITSHTTSVSLNKWLLDKRLLVRPSFRYYSQSEADYYGVSFSGDPDYFSSDYRISAEETFNLGIQLRYIAIPDRLSIEAGYERYITRGTDGETSQSAYPDAHSFSIGARLSF